MSDWTLQVDVAPMVDRLTNISLGLAQRAKVHERIIITLQRRIHKNKPTAPPLSGFTKLTRQGNALLQDTNALFLSLIGVNPGQISTADGTLNMATMTVATFGSKLPYANLQNRGGTIRPTNSANLALPATDEAKQAGSPKSFPDELYWIPVKSSSGHATGWLATRTGTGKAAELVREYLLMDEVTIPARRFFPTEEEVREDSGKVLNHYISGLLKGLPPEEAAALGTQTRL